MLHYLTRRFFYPSNSGRPIRRDPTYGKISRTIQWLVEDHYEPRTTSTRVALESRLQQIRHKEKS